MHLGSESRGVLKKLLDYDLHTRFMFPAINATFKLIYLDFAKMYFQSHRFCPKVTNLLVTTK